MRRSAVAATIERVSAASRARDTRTVYLRRVMPYKAPDPVNIPTDFLIYWNMFYGLPMRGYQAIGLNQLFPAVYGHSDISWKQARQSGKTIPSSYLLGYLIVFESWPIVVISSKEEKTRKISRVLLRLMRSSGRPLAGGAEGVREARFAEQVNGWEPGFVCMSGKPMSERESETAKLVVVDESQDVLHEPVWPDISPMLLSTGGCVMSMGIGGTIDSMIEVVRETPGAIKIDIPWTMVLDNWGVPDGRDQDYRRRAMSDMKVMRPEIFGAHYEGKTIPQGSLALYKYLIPWSEAYPGVPFDPEKHLVDASTRYSRARIGVDWGKRVDFSCALLVASGGPSSAREIVICGYNKFESMDYTVQAAKLTEWLDAPKPYDIPYDKVQPEMNGVGEAATDAFKAALRTAQFRQCCEAVDIDDAAKLSLAEKLSQPAMSKRLIYVDEAADPEGKCKHLNLHLAGACAKELKAVGIKYTSSARGTLKTNYTHSDWNSALFAAMAEPAESYESGV